MHCSCSAFHIDDILYNNILIFDFENHDFLIFMMLVIVMLRTVYVMKEKDHMMRK